MCCFGKRSRKVVATPERFESLEKMNDYYKNYLSCTYAFLLNNESDNKKVLVADVKYRLDSIKAKMIAHANMHLVKYGESIETRIHCLQLVEQEFNTMIASLYSEGIILIDPQLQKLKSVQYMLNINE